MKVLQLINSLGAGGAEKLLVDAAITHSNMGVHVDILLLRNVDSPFVSKLKNHPNINVFWLSDTGSVYNPLHILKLNKYFKKYDIVHVHLFPCLYWAGIASLFGKNYKLVYTEHNTTNRRRESKVFKILDKVIYKRFDEIVTISDSVDKNLKEHLGKSFKNLTKIYNGIDLKEINMAQPYPKKELGLTDSAISIIQVSSFTAQKNQNFLIKSLKRLPENYFLLLVGDGVLRKQSEELAQKIGVQERVHFMGVRKDVPRLLKTADLVILSSHFEGLSLSSVEGLASGKPFLASDVPGLTEVVEGAGLLFEDDNMDSLVGHIQKLMDDKIFQENVALKSQERAKKYDIITMCRQYQTLYQKE
ncbi:glycosyltransferase [Muricauda oceani]|uniref:Glycosyltransferase n=1 Tax=Flagellimonas oceani TaxID=2698672 RepID=A0A6G7J120_9FLAO|nr:glycosyltransferase [Allomuricauda oceani]MBW8245110.1 glycosyltransferase [Allomuricauda oceani]QII44197.1 glycosyltransferase [Allomuricauda oceani]